MDKTLSMRPIKIIISALEKEFDIQFDIDEIERLVSVSDMVSIIATKTS